MIATNPTHQEIMIFSQNRRKHALSLVLIKVHKGNRFYSACTVECKLNLLLMRLQISLKCWFPFRGLDVIYNISFRRHQQFEFLKGG